MAPEHSQPPTEWVGVSSRGRTAEIVTIVFFGLSFVAVVLRLVARLTSVRRLLSDDYMCIVSQILGFALMADVIILVESSGLGWHIKELPRGQILEFFKVYLAGELIYGAIVVSYKLTVLLLYRHIFGEVKRFNIVSWVFIGIVTAWYIAAMVTAFLQCTPVEKLWNPFYPGSCFNQDAWILSHGIVNIALDVIILALPLPLIWKLTLTAKKRLALSAVFLLGSIVCISSIVRLVNSYPINFTDPTYGLYAVTTWSQIEPAIGIIGACLPTLRQYFFGSFTRQSKYSSEYQSSNNTGQDSATRSNTAAALTGWRSNEAYVEVGSEMETRKSSSGPASEAHKSSSAINFSSSFLDVDPVPGAADDSEVDSNSIRVKKEVSVFVK